MTTRDDDRDLRDAFADARRREQAAAPPFDRVWRGAADRPGRTGYWRPIAVAAALLAALAIVRPQVPAPSPRPPAPSITDWRSSTDFLLETPSRSLLTGLPALGRLPDYPRLDPRPETKD